MNIELTGEETAILISALTVKKSRLEQQRVLFLADGMKHWVADVDAEILRVDALKERLFK